MSTPRATYRLQLRDGVTFADAGAALPYLAALGGQHVYLSPILQAAPGSTHGYDVVDPRQVDVALGGEVAFERFCAAAQAAGLGVVLDIVPNHMADRPGEPVVVGRARERPGQPLRGSFRCRVGPSRAPSPGPHPDAHPGRPLRTGPGGRRAAAAAGCGGFVVRYHEQRLPVAVRSLGELLRPRRRGRRPEELGFLADAVDDLPQVDPGDAAAVARHDRDVRVLAARLEALAAERVIGDALEAVVATTNADIEAVDRLLERQVYRLAWWRAARRDLGYRRFFDVTTLVGLRVEDAQVFRDTHRLVLRWFADGLLDGLRIDHPDGLRDPEGYLRELRWAAPRAWLVVEKILGQDESLRPRGRSREPRATSASAGSTRPARPSQRAKRRCAPSRAVHRRPSPFDEMALEGKDTAPRATSSAASWHASRRCAGRAGAAPAAIGDYTRHDLHEALGELIADLSRLSDVHPRSGDRPGIVRVGRPSARGRGGRTRARVGAGDTAGARSPRRTRRSSWRPAGGEGAASGPAGGPVRCHGDLLLFRLGTGDAEAEFVARFQQLTGPAIAKGVEDTALYRYLRLLALNEVGVDPGRWCDPPRCAARGGGTRADASPAAMLTTSTHDTKRSEDVRARSLVLTIIRPLGRARRRRGWRGWRPSATRWSTVPPSTSCSRRWSRRGRSTRTGSGGTSRRRSARRSSGPRGPRPTQPYEAAVLAFVHGVLADAGFRDELDAFVIR